MTPAFGDVDPSVWMAWLLLVSSLDPCSRPSMPAIIAFKRWCALRCKCHLVGIRSLEEASLMTVTQMVTMHGGKLSGENRGARDSLFSIIPADFLASPTTSYLNFCPSRRSGNPQPPFCIEKPSRRWKRVQDFEVHLSLDTIPLMY